MNSAKNPNIYSIKKVKKAVFHFLSGRIVSSLIGFFTTIFIVRTLPAPAYAAYAVMLGLTIGIGTISSFALQLAAQRFIPELLSRPSNRLVKRLTQQIVALRLFLLFLTTIFFYFLIPEFSNFFSLQLWIHEFRYWFFATFVMVSYRFICLLLETFLNQKSVKWLQIILTSLRFLGVLILILKGSDVPLVNIIFVEGISHGICLILATIHLSKTLKKLETKNCLFEHDDKLWGRIKDYCCFNHLRQLTIIVSGFSADSLIVSKFLPPGVMAAYGFAKSLSEIIQRYIPSFLLQNLLQPVLMSQFSQNSDFENLTKKTKLIFKINLFMIGPLLIWIGSTGDAITSLLSKGKYPDAGWILLLLLIMLALENYTQMLTTIFNAAEKNKAAFFSDLVNAAFLFPAIILINIWGLSGLLIARICGLIFKNFFLAYRLKKDKIYYNHDAISLCKILVSCILAITIMSQLPVNSYIHLFLSAVFSLFLFLVCTYIVKPFTLDERAAINRMIGKNIFVW